MITLSSASRGSPVSRTRWPAIACERSTGNSTTSAPSRRTAPTSSSASGSADSVVVTPSRAASPSNVVPCRTVETSTAKKTMLKNSTLPSTPADHRERRQHHGDRAAQARPAEHDALREPEAHAERRHEHAERPRDEHDDERSTVPSSATSPSSDGNTSSPSTRNMTTWASQPMPSWKVTIVRLAGICADPSASPAR